MPDGRPWPRISIVTPSYNQRQFIEETLRSVLLQGYPNLEYIVIDGGSTDGSVEIIRKYERWLSYWLSEHDRGQSDAINKGWARASGAVLAWLNSDDYYTPGAMSQIASAVSIHESASLVYGDCLVLSDVTGQNHVLRPGWRDLRLLISDGPMPQPSVFLRKHVFQQCGALDEQLHYAMDYDLWLRAAAVGPFVYLAGKTLAVFREQPKAKSYGYPLRFAPEHDLVLSRAARRYPSLRGPIRVAQARFYYSCAEASLLHHQKPLACLVWLWRACAGDPRLLLRIPRAARHVFGSRIKTDLRSTSQSKIAS